MYRSEADFICNYTKKCALSSLKVKMNVYKDKVLLWKFKRVRLQEVLFKYNSTETIELYFAWMPGRRAEAM